MAGICCIRTTTPDRLVGQWAMRTQAAEGDAQHNDRAFLSKYMERPVYIEREINSDRLMVTVQVRIEGGVNMVTENLPEIFQDRHWRPCRSPIPWSCKKWIWNLFCKCKCKC